MAAFAGVLVYATASYINAEITAGELAMYVVAFRQAMVYLRDAVTGYSGLAENRLFLQDLFGFLDLKGDMAGGGEGAGAGFIQRYHCRKYDLHLSGSRPAGLAGY